MENYQEEPKEESPEESPRFFNNRFIAIAEAGNNSPFKYVATMLIILGCFIFLGQIPLLAGTFVHALMQGEEGLKQFMDGKVYPNDTGIDKTLFLGLYILTFVISLLALFLLMRWYHQRSWKTLITPNKSFNFKKIFIAGFIYLVILVAAEVYMYIENPETYSIIFDAYKFIPLLLVSIILLPFQTSFEEIFFRGYLLQGMSLAFKNTWAPLLITSLLFALLHSWNPEVQKHGFFMMFPFYFGFGLFLGLIALLDESLEIPLTIHFVNNFYGSVVVTFPESALQTDSIFMMQTMDPAKMLPLWMAGMCLMFLIMKRVFGWKDFSKVLR